MSRRTMPEEDYSACYNRMLDLDAEVERLTTENEKMSEVFLTPVEVFGAEGGYGLMDASSAWSDCNRAIGHIFRVDDLADNGNPERVRVRVLVSASELEKLAVRYGEE